MKNRKREICTSGSVRDEDGQPPHLLGRRQFLHLAAGAAALADVSRFGGGCHGLCASRTVAVLLPSCIRHGHCPRSSDLNQLRKLLSFMPTLLANSSARSVQVFASLPSVAPAALAAVFGRYVHISQNVTGD